MWRETAQGRTSCGRAFLEEPRGSLGTMRAGPWCTVLPAGCQSGELLAVFLPVLCPFARYEYFNPQQKGEEGQTMDARCQVSKWVAGVNYFPLPYLVVKADWNTRRIGTQRVFGGGRYNRENEFSLAVAFTGWFFKR